MTERDANMMSRWTLGRVLTCLMLIVAAMELTLRLVPIDVSADRPYEALGHFHTLDGPFQPNAEFHNTRSYGDLTALGNLPKRRLYHQVDFTTDEFGFHNPSSTADLSWAGILFGDSFAIGAEVPEEKTLSAQLSTLFSGPIYNAGGYLPVGVERVHRLADRLKLRRGVFVYEFHEAHLREFPPVTASLPPTWRHKIAVRVLGSTGSLRLKEGLSSLFELRLSLIAQKYEKAIENNELLPNSFAGTVIEGRFQNGDWMLFLRSRVLPIDSPERAIKCWADFFGWLSGELGRDGLDLVVMIVPDSSTVYAPLLASPNIPTRSAVVLSQLADRLRQGGIRVVNVTPVFRAAASELLESHQYLYWRDDTHWNACGITIAVAEFQAQLSEYLRIVRSPSEHSNLGTRTNCGSEEISQNLIDSP
jgi:hypothetical protein